MAYEPIITNNAQKKMKEYGITKEELLSAFYSSMIEESRIPNCTVGITRFRGWEICAVYTKDAKGQWVVVSCWKRKHFP